MVWYSHLFKNFPQFVEIQIVKGFSVVNEAEVDVFLKLLCFLYDPMNIGYLISASSAFSKSSLNIWNFMVHVLLDGIPVKVFQILKDGAVKSAALNMPTDLENSSVAKGLAKVSLHSNPKERQCQRMFKLPHNCTHLTC